MQLLPAASAHRLDLRAKLRFSLKNAIVGFFVVFPYGAGIVWFATARGLPLPVLIINGLMWLFFFWYWQRNLRRVLGGARPFSFATTARSVVFPLNDVDKDVPEELDRYVEVPSVEIREVELLDLRTVVRHRRTNRTMTSNRQTPMVRLHVREPVPAEVQETLTKIRRRSGFQVVHVNLPSPDVVEVFVRKGQFGAIERALVSLDPRLKPRRVTRTDDFTAGGEGVEEALERLEAAGDGMTSTSARRLLERAED